MGRTTCSSLLGLTRTKQTLTSRLPCSHGKVNPSERLEGKEINLHNSTVQTTCGCVMNSINSSCVTLGITESRCSLLKVNSFVLSDLKEKTTFNSTVHQDYVLTRTEPSSSRIPTIALLHTSGMARQRSSSILSARKVNHKASYTVHGERVLTRRTASLLQIGGIIVSR